MVRAVPERPRGPRPALAPLAVALVMALGAGCAVPVPEPTAGPDPDRGQGDRGVALTTTDTGGVRLAAQLAVLDAAVAAVAAALDRAGAAASAGDLDAARTAGAAAVAALIGTDAADATPGAAPVLPATAPDRAGGGSTDLLSTTVTLAGDVGGERARVVLELVRDPLVGDLGAWQRDAPGVIAGLRGTVAAAGSDPAALDAGLAAAAGELTRALGYALAVADAPDVAIAAHAARAGADRLGVVRVALDLGTAAVAGDDA